MKLAAVGRRQAASWSLPSAGVMEMARLRGQVQRGSFWEQVHILSQKNSRKFRHVVLLDSRLEWELFL